MTEEIENINRKRNWVVPGARYFNSVMIAKSREVFYNGLEQESILIARRKEAKRLFDICSFNSQKQKTAGGKWLKEIAAIDAYFERYRIEGVA